MCKDFEELVEFSRLAQVVNVRGDALICDSPALLFAVEASSDAGGKGDAEVHDGHSSTEAQVIDLACLNGGQDCRKYWPPLYFRHGIYLDCGDKIESVLFQFIPLRD